jgi:hypothetical protein
LYLQANVWLVAILIAMLCTQSANTSTAHILGFGLFFSFLFFALFFYFIFYFLGVVFGFSKPLKRLAGKGFKGTALLIIIFSQFIFSLFLYPEINF